MVENTTTQKRSFVERLRDRIEGRKVEGEQGSLILDILIGMAIFALIAIIAVSAIGQYRARAYAQSTVSDAQAVGLAVEAAVTDGLAVSAANVNGRSTLTIGGTGGERVVLSHGGGATGNGVTGFTAPTAANGYTFSFCVDHGGAEWSKYDSTRGGIVKTERSGFTAAKCTAA